MVWNRSNNTTTSIKITSVRQSSVTAVLRTIIFSGHRYYRMPNGVKIYRRKFEGNQVSLKYLRANLVGYVRLGEVQVLYGSLVLGSPSP